MLSRFADVMVWLYDHAEEIRGAAMVTAVLMLAAGAEGWAQWFDLLIFN